MMNINPQGWVANRDQRPNAGIDVSKQHLDACWGAQELRVDNDATGWDELIAKLKDAGVDLVVIEATGGYERELVCALQSAHQLPLVAAGGFDHHQVDAGVLELRDQLVPPSRVVVDTQLLRTPASIQMLLGNVDAGVRTLIAIRYPALRIDVHHWQLFGLHGWTERADALTKCSIASLASPRGIRFGAPTAKLAAAPGCGQVDSSSCARTGRLAVENAARCPPRQPLPT